MKKYLLIAFSLISFLSFGQKKIDLNDYTTQNNETLSKRNDILKLYPKETKSSKIIFEDSEKLHLSNGLILLNLKIDDKFYTHKCIVYNPKTNESITYFSKESKKEVQIFDSKKILIYTIKKDSKKLSIVFNNTTPSITNAKKSCFKTCMEDAEDAVVDGFVGWAAWNLSPGVQLAAAINCEGGCNGWW